MSGVRLEDPTGKLAFSSMRPVAKEQHNVDLLLSQEMSKLLSDTAHAEEQDAAAHAHVTPTSCTDLVANKDAFVLQGVLTAQECETLVQGSEKLKYSFWSEDPAKWTFRSAETVEVTSKALADRLWGRMSQFVPPSVEFADESDPRWARDIAGKWEACGINECMLFARYVKGGHFSPHTDGNTIMSLNHRSFYTVLVYLNHCEVGGATRLLSLQDGQAFAHDDKGRLRAPEECVIASAAVRVGHALVFYQDMVHEGEPVGDGCEKYIIRTDVMFKRVPPVCTGEKDVEAYKIMKQAEDLEADGKCDEAAVLFRKAFKMSRELADIYGM